MIDLNKFCATENEMRVHLRAPWAEPGIGIVRTNGFVLICTPPDGKDYASSINLPNNEKLIGMQKSAAKKRGCTFVSLKNINLPHAKICFECDGAGHIYEKKCDGCGGKGNFFHRTHQYSCKECDGEGFFKSLIGDEENKKFCEECNGFGELFQLVKIKSCFFDRKYLALLNRLPNCVLSLPQGDPTAQATFTFDGGWGALMPCTGNTKT